MLVLVLHRTPLTTVVVVGKKNVEFAHQTAGLTGRNSRGAAHAESDADG